MTNFCILFFVCIFVANKAVADWNYLEQRKWPAKDCLDGRKQSPINIHIKNATLAKTAPLQFNNKISEKLKANIRNEDYTVAVYLEDMSTKAVISKGGLNGSFAFLRFDFRWPSQHRINNKRFPLEITLVFYATKYGKPENAIPHKDGFVALCAFFEISEKSNPIFDNLIRSIPEISHKMNEGPVPLQEEIVISDFIPKKYIRYFRYFGSYMRPKCDEIVTYVIFQGPSYISLSQYYALIDINDKAGQLVRFNNRNIQYQNGRKVLKSA
ncbi:receptor-type tyrosine-protein phosphatase gamma-like [Zophobas morio]|uniref:receptor-type tyrosine-protein phosphatase gamma-like n=1 Tax=Zophobas morio TaxID=2755281 RepID=UPI003082B01C